MACEHAQVRAGAEVHLQGRGVPDHPRRGPRLNLASFVTTWMEPECDRLILEGINKSYADMDEYPVTTELQAHASI